MRQQACVNRFVLDFLRQGPVELESLYKAAFQWDRAPRGMIDGALMHFGVKRLKQPDTGARYVDLPPNLVAIWWNRKSWAPFRSQRFGGGTAA